MGRMNETIQTITVYALPLLFAITVHEASHAYAARYLGDSTAYLQGRMTLNPVKHIDPIGTLLIPILLFVVGSPYLFGYAKPVPVEWGNLHKPKRDMGWVALAGPASNMVMAVMWMVLWIFLWRLDVGETFFLRMAEAGVLVNLVIFALNLFPIPPLDGGRIVTSLLPHRASYQFARLEPYGFFIILALLFLGGLHYWLRPVMQVAYEIIALLVAPLKFLLG